MWKTPKLPSDLLSKLLLGFLAILVLGPAFNSWRNSNNRLPTISSLVYRDRAALLQLSDGRVYRALLDEPAFNNRNLVLLYPGKRVWIEGSHHGSESTCVDIAPVKEEQMPMLSIEQYGTLVQTGFSNEEISYSFTLPPDAKNSNGKKTTYGGLIEYGAPRICAVIVK